MNCQHVLHHRATIILDLDHLDIWDFLTIAIGWIIGTLSLHQIHFWTHIELHCCTFHILTIGLSDYRHFRHFAATSSCKVETSYHTVQDKEDLRDEMTLSGSCNSDNVNSSRSCSFSLSDPSSAAAFASSDLLRFLGFLWMPWRSSGVIRIGCSDLRYIYLLVTCYYLVLVGHSSWHHSRICGFIAVSEASEIHLSRRFSVTWKVLAIIIGGLGSGKTTLLDTARSSAFWNKNDPVRGRELGDHFFGWSTWRVTKNRFDEKKLVFFVSICSMCVLDKFKFAYFLIACKVSKRHMCVDMHKKRCFQGCTEYVVHEYFEHFCTPLFGKYFC